MEPGYEEFQQFKLSVIPGADVLNSLFQAHLLVSLILHEFAKLEMELNRTLLVATNSADLYEQLIWPTIPFKSKISMLRKVCEKNTVRVNGKAYPRDISLELKNLKIIDQLHKCYGFRNTLSHSLWMGVKEPENEQASFQMLYGGEIIDWKIDYLLEILAIIIGVALKLKKFDPGQNSGQFSS